MNKLSLVLLIVLLMLITGCKIDLKNIDDTKKIIGKWGQEDVLFIIGETSATTDYHCAHGSIDEPFIIDSTGKFSVKGTHTPESGGAMGTKEVSFPALYAGQLKDDKMSLTVINPTTMEVFSNLSLSKNKDSPIIKCP